MTDAETNEPTCEKRSKTKILFTPMTPESTFQFADLNIKHTGAKNTIAMVQRAIRMGYDSVAINIDIGDISDYFTESDMLWTPATGDELLEPPKKKKKGKVHGELATDGLAKVLKKRMIPPPFYVNADHLNTSELEKRGKVFRQFSRLTFTANEQVVLNKTFIHPTVLKYDLIAVRPGDPSVLDTLSRKTELFDVITIDNLEMEKAKWVSQSKVLERMRGDGIYYEMTYSELLQHVTRKNSLFNGRVLLRSLKSRNVIISSGSESMIDLRAPVDVMNMAMLWGIKSNIARMFTSTWPKNLLLQAECRGTVNGDLHAMKLRDAKKLVKNDDEEKPAINIRMMNITYNQLLKATEESKKLLDSLKQNSENNVSS